MQCELKTNKQALRFTLVSIERTEAWRWVRTLQIGEDPALFMNELVLIKVDGGGRP